MKRNGVRLIGAFGGGLMTLIVFKKSFGGLLKLAVYISEFKVFIHK
jgi:hypothetical protein